MENLANKLIQLFFLIILPFQIEAKNIGLNKVFLLDTIYHPNPFVYPFEGNWKFKNDSIEIELEIKCYKKVLTKDTYKEVFMDHLVGWYTYKKRGALIEDFIQKRDSSVSGFVKYLENSYNNYLNIIKTPLVNTDKFIESTFFANLRGGECYNIKNIFCIFLNRKVCISNNSSRNFESHLLMKGSLSEDQSILTIKCTPYDIFKYPDDYSKLENDYFSIHKFPATMNFKRVK